jgi:hypothetical protein
MSVLVALKMLGRLAGAILTVLSRVDVTTEKDIEALASRVGYIFLGRRAAAELCDFGTQIQFCGEPRQGCAIGGLEWLRVSRPSPAVAAKKGL